MVKLDCGCNRLESTVLSYCSPHWREVHQGWVDAWRTAPSSSVREDAHRLAMSGVGLEADPDYPEPLVSVEDRQWYNRLVYVTLVRGRTHQLRRIFRRDLVTEKVATKEFAATLLQNFVTARPSREWVG